MIEDKIFRLDISVQDRVFVEVLEAEQHASDEKLRLLFGEFPFFADMVSKVTTTHQINDQIQVVTVLKSVVHVDQESVIELTEELFLVHD